MYNNNYFNPFMYQSYNPASNFTRGLGSAFTRSNAFSSTIPNSMMGTNKLSTLGKGLLGKFSFSGFLNGASKTLNVVNQAIPIYYQVKPIFNNARTMFRIMGAVKDDDKTLKSNTTNNQNINYPTSTKVNKPTINQINNNVPSFQEENPTFFI